jgi:acetoin utilization deacetylase AcuC-like enzyme
VKKVGYVYHPYFLKHISQDYHPENPQRLKVIEKALDKSGLKKKLVMIDPEPAAPEDILLNHSEKLYKLIESTQAYEYGNIDPDTYYCRDSYAAAMLAAGGAIKAGRMVMEGAIDSAFCALRPPGHHAEPHRAMGFCLFNNIAILARRMMKDYHLERIAIFDWDGHHGNGTQWSFYDTDKVYYCSLHQYPWYPGTGRANEIGKGVGEGYNLNFPMPPGTGDAEFINTIKNGWVNAMEKYKPELLLVSAGYDAFADDPYVLLDVTEKGLNAAMRESKCAAEIYCGGKMIVLLEGGYVYDFLANTIVNHIKIMME